MDMTQFPLSKKTRNLVRFARHLGWEALDESFMSNFGFRDRGSRFSILKSPKTAPGPDECWSLYKRDARLLFDKLLGLEIEYPGIDQERFRRASLYNSMNYYRSHIEEFFYTTGLQPLPPVEGRCMMFFPEPDRLAVQYHLRNTSAADVTVRLRWLSAPTPGLGHEHRVLDDGFAFLNTQKCGVPYRSAAFVRTTEPDVLFAWQEGTCDSSWIERTIAAGQTLRVQFDIAFTLEPDASLDALPPAAPGADLVPSMRQTEAVYERLPELAQTMCRFEPLVLKAAGTLRTLRYLERMPDGRRVMTIHPGKAGCASTYFWDGAFTLLGLGLLGDTETGQGLSEVLLGGIREDGTPPCTYEGGEYMYGHQQPIYAWGLGHFLTRRPDEEFLGRSYQPLARYLEHWLQQCDKDGNGLAEYPAGGVCWDDALRWHNQFPIDFKRGETWHEREWGRMQPHLFESVDTNSYLYLECSSMARMARRLGRESEAARWDERAERLAVLVNERLYDEESGTYQERSVEDGRFAGMLTPSSFMPLYAGIAPKERAERLARDYLLNPERFYTTMPFPTLDRSHPAFRSGGFLHTPESHPESLVQHAYWIGRAWPHVSFWLVGAIHNAGLTDEADQAAMRILDAMSRSEAIYECYDSLTGYGNGHAEFMWSSAAVLALAYQLYKQGPVGQL